MDRGTWATRLALTGTVVAVLMQAACGSDEGNADPPRTPSPSENNTSQEPTAPTPSTDDATSDTPSPGASRGSSDPVADFPAGTAAQRGRGSGSAGLVLTDVRVGDHDGFDRVVLEFSGDGTPGWRVEVVDKAVLEGSGQVAALDGDATLQIVASGMTAPAPDYYSGPRRVEAQLGSLREVYVGGTFEGYTQVFAGIDDAVPFRAFTLSGPSRLVVDVRDE